MASLVDEVAKSLGVEPKFVERDALKLWLERKLRFIEAEIFEILDRYHVESVDELERRIVEGDAPEHPGWEDLITLERLTEERKKILEALKRVT